MLWLQNGNDIMMSDTEGQYPAIIRAMNLNGIQTFSVLDPHAHPKPKGIKLIICNFFIKLIFCMDSFFKC